MTPLRARMIEDMVSAGLAQSTQTLYIRAVYGLAACYRRSPEEPSEAEVRNYLLGLRERGVALGTFRPYHGGIKFLYSHTLDRHPSTSACPRFSRMPRPAPSSAM